MFYKMAGCRQMFSNRGLRKGGGLCCVRETGRTQKRRRKFKQWQWCKHFVLIVSLGDMECNSRSTISCFTMLKEQKHRKARSSNRSGHETPSEHITALPVCTNGWQSSPAHGKASGEKPPWFPTDGEIRAVAPRRQTEKYSVLCCRKTFKAPHTENMEGIASRRDGFTGNLLGKTTELDLLLTILHNRWRCKSNLISASREGGFLPGREPAVNPASSSLSVQLSAPHTLSHATAALKTSAAAQRYSVN